MKAYHKFQNDSEQTKEEYVKDLKNFEIEMQKIGIDIFLFYGTLLGAIREKDFIPHDNDIDIACCVKLRGKDNALIERKRIEEYLKKNKWLRNRKTNGIKISYHKSKFDLWVGYIENNIFYVFTHKISKTLILPLSKLMFRNQEFNVPNNSEATLDAIYIDWTRPIPKNQQYLK